MERYIGMDVHAASCTLAVISEKGRKLRDFPVETNGRALVVGPKHLVDGSQASDRAPPDSQDRDDENDRSPSR